MASPALRWTTRAALAALVFFLLAAADLALRSRGALARAEQEMAWAADPAAKAAWYGAVYAGKAEKVKKDLAAGRLTPAAAARADALLQAERDFRISESSAKMAFIWYRSAAEEFRSPLNPWSARAAAAMPRALAAWKAELAAAGVKAAAWQMQ